MLPIYENTKQALGFDPDGEHEFDLEMPEKFYPSTVEQFLEFLQKEAPNAIIICAPPGWPAADDDGGGGMSVRGGAEDGAQVESQGLTDADEDPGGAPALPSQGSAGSVPEEQ